MSRVVSVVLLCCCIFAAASASNLLEELKTYHITKVTSTIPTPSSLSFMHAPTKKDLQFASAGPSHEEILHPSLRLLTFSAFEQTFELELFKNHQLISPDYTEYREQNKVPILTRTRADIVNCYYIGRVKSGSSDADNRVSLSTCNGVHGQIHVNGETYIITPAAHHISGEEHKIRSLSVTESDHLVYRVRDLATKDDRAYCGVGHHNVPQSLFNEPNTVTHSHDNHNHDMHIHSDHDHSDEDDHHHHNIKTMRKGFHTTATRILRYVEVHVVNDYARFVAKGINTEQHSLSLINGVAAYYRDSTDLSIAEIIPILMGQTTWIDRTSNIAITTNVRNETLVENYLPDFRNWLSTNTNRYRNLADQGTLISGNKFRDNVVGFAYTGAICTSNSASINQADHYTNDAFDIATISHELGHNLGMCHDPPADRSSNICSSLAQNIVSSCTGRIMSASSSLSNPPTRFSLCSNSDFAFHINDSSFNCLGYPNPLRVYGNTSVCGNGFVEGNETCDCGPYSNCATAPAPWTDSCCEGNSGANKCQLKVGAVCSNLRECCTDCSFTPLAAARVCRAKGSSSTATEECDIAEQCDGTSALCPVDKFNEDGKSCTPNLLSAGVNWAKENWELLLIIGLAVLGAIVFYVLIKKIWACCFDEDESKVPEKLKQSQSFRNIRNKVQERKKLQALEMQNRGVATVGGIALPAHWQVRYTRQGVPIYINTLTGERYDFRRGPPKASQLAAPPSASLHRPPAAV